MPTPQRSIPSTRPNSDDAPPRRSLRLSDSTWCLVAEVRGLARLASESASVDSVLCRALHAEGDRLRAKLKGQGIDPAPQPERNRSPYGVPVARGLIDAMRLGAPSSNIEP